MADDHDGAFLAFLQFGELEAGGQTAHGAVDEEGGVGLGRSGEGAAERKRGRGEECSCFHVINIALLHRNRYTAAMVPKSGAGEAETAGPLR